MQLTGNAGARKADAVTDNIRTMHAGKHDKASFKLGDNTLFWMQPIFLQNQFVAVGKLISCAKKIWK